MNAQVTAGLLIVALVAGCSSRAAAPQPITAQVQPTVEIVYVTPTPKPTLVPTAARFTVTETVEASAISTPSFDSAADCEDLLSRRYAAASDQCLAGPTGFFCNGGRPPESEPKHDALSAPGALVEAARIDSLHSRPFTVDGAGLVWLRLEENIRMDAVLIGDVRISNVASGEGGGVRWRSLTVESGKSVTDCPAAPEVGALVVQSLYGQSARVTVNGVSANINGTLIVLTQDRMTKFIVIEGQVLLVAYGNSAALDVGQQLNLTYAESDWTRPVALPGNPIRLEYDLIKHLPVELFDRAMPIPQPGFAQTQGGVNMRAAPDINSRLLFQVPAGETMGVLGISSDRQWLHIRFGNGETGWMSAELLVRNLGEIAKVYDVTPVPPQRLGAHANHASVNVAAGGNLREAPDTAFRVKRTLPYGLEVKLLARSPYSPWVKVEASDTTGWMALFTLKTRSVISSLPIDYDVPLPPRATPTPSFSYGGGHAYPDPKGGY